VRGAAEDWEVSIDFEQGFLHDEAVLRARQGGQGYDRSRFLTTNTDEWGRPILIDLVETRTMTAEEAEATSIRLPAGVVRAIAEAVKPGPSQGETARLEEALNVERARTDLILDALLHREVGGQ
jgi:hypothetical protein